MHSKPFEGNYPITQNYGGGHDGVDFGCPIGTPLYNFEKGKVVLAGFLADRFPAHLKNGENLAVIVQAESDGGFHAYFHLSEIAVKVGQILETGQYLGKSGNTGYSRGPHLHFAIYTRLYNITVDPAPYLAQAKNPSEFSKPPANNRFYAIKFGGWRSNVIQEIINAGIWSGTWKENEPKFLELNGLPPQGGYRAGMQVRIAPDPVVQVATPPQSQVDSVNKIPEPIPAPLPIQPQPEAISIPAPTPMPTVSIEKPFIFSDPIQPQLPEPEPIQQTLAERTMDLEQKLINTQKALEQAHETISKKPEQFSILKAWKGAEQVGVISASVVSGVGILTASFVAYQPVLREFVDPSTISIIGASLGVLSIAAKTIYTLFKR